MNYWMTAMRSILTKPVNLLCCLLLALPAMAKQTDYQQKIYVDSKRQLAELGDNKVSFIDEVTINQGTVVNVYVARDVDFSAVVANLKR